MTFKRAVRLAVMAIKDKIQELSFDANMHDVYRADYPLAIHSSKSKAEYLDAINILEKEVKEKGGNNGRKKNDTQEHF